MRTTPKVSVLIVAVTGVLGVGCADDGAPADTPLPDTGADVADVGAETDTASDVDDVEDAPPQDTAPPSPSAALIEAGQALGMDRYLETLPEPSLQADANGVQTWAWQVGDGPLCMRGDAFRFSTRAGDPERLLIFLQGGGACWDAFCLAVNRAPAGIPNVDALNVALEANPLAAWSVAYLPYCDGSLFAGDRDHDEDADGAPDRYHRGLQNLSGALAQTRTLHPAPRQILLTGSSAGGFGTILATILVRITWPDAELLVFNDSGVGVAREGDTAFLTQLLDQFGATDLIPADCEDCVTDGHIAPLVGWTLARDPNLRIAVFSSWYDSIIGDVFLQTEAPVFAASLATQTGALHAAYPDRYRRFLIDGTTHTALLGNPTGIIGSDFSSIELPPGFLSQLSSVRIGSLAETRSGDVTVGAWLDAFVNGSPDWVDIVEGSGASPW